MSVRFIQIAIADSDEGTVTVFALDDRGRLWEGWRQRPNWIWVEMRLPDEPGPFPHGPMPATRDLSGPPHPVFYNPVTGEIGPLTPPQP